MTAPPTYAELRRLLAEATPGPVVAHVEKYSAHLRAPSGRIAEVFAPNLPEMEPNALLFAAMRNTLPGLLAEAEAGRKLREQCDILQGYLEQCRECRAGTAEVDLKAALADYDREVGT